MPLPVGDGPHPHRQVDGEDGQLRDDHDFGEGHAHPDPTKVDHRVQQHEPDQPRPHRNLRDGGVHRDRGHQVQQPGHEGVVQQDRPPGQEPHRRADPTPGVVVDAAGQGECPHHLRVRRGGEQQRHHPDQIRQHRHPTRRLIHRPEDRERGDRHHENQAVEDQVHQSDPAQQILPVPELANAFPR